jgi:hypothetical protein
MFVLSLILTVVFVMLSIMGDCGNFSAIPAAIWGVGTGLWFAAVLIEKGW